MRDPPRTEVMSVATISREETTVDTSTVSESPASFAPCVKNAVRVPYSPSSQPVVAALRAATGPESETIRTSFKLLEVDDSEIVSWSWHFEINDAPVEKYIRLNDTQKVWDFLSRQIASGEFRRWRKNRRYELMS